VQQAEDARTDPDIPRRTDCVVRDLLDRWAEEKPDAPFAVFWNGPTLTYADMRDRARSAAAGLAAAGVRQGDTVVVWLPNSADCLATWFGINWMGAIYVPINLAYRGHLLDHVLENAGARVIVVHADLLPRLAAAKLARLDTAIVVGGAGATVPGLRLLPEATLRADPANDPPLQTPIEPWDMQSIIYTSGTTGPSKGVLSSYAHLHAMSGPISFNMVTAEDRYMCNLPLFHVGGTIPVMGMLIRGGSVAIIDAFSTATFWTSLRETHSTVVLLLGAMATFVTKQEPGPADRDHALRKVIIVPLAEDAPRFAARFGVDVYTLFNMTEIATPIVSGPNPARTGICGKARPGVELRLVDANDCRVAQGETGELIVRSDGPWALNSGYFKDAEATVRAWRNGWFHTGDAFRQDDEGNFVFVDRMKDAIRRRGENISSFEVEAEIAAHPLVNEVAVVAVPSEVQEDEILCIVAPSAGNTIDPVELTRFLVERLPYFMVPRYVRVVDALPRTPTSKIQKHVLRQQGITPDTWDREAAGIILRRERIG
jgi:crotonobetaine/carnitine-CoA ligase